MPAVLYVDDEPALRRLVRRWYERRGVTMRVAASVAEAKRILSEDDIVGAFVDVWLGAQTGFDLYAWIAEFRPRLKDRVVFITGDVVPGADNGNVQALGRAVITKPFGLDDLEPYVRAWIGNGGGARISLEEPGARGQA
ncbi:MAG: response regulator [Gemmatimonadaceae bacterium]|nr:response regulator [Gemmatimonadaceae bacterium]NUQ92283.1 response regulator [Gemmatimonadaceae bacterium]NUR20445.1 response regulator [Gemmatimonadaceae bacterium]